MSYSKNLLLYQDAPTYGLFLKLIIVIAPASLLSTSIYLWQSGESTGSLVLLAESFFIGLIFWIVFPRRYEVYEDHLRIVLGGPVVVKIGFETIETIRITSKPTFSVNFVTTLAKRNVEIVKKRGLSIAITPGDDDLFVENASRALSQWIKSNHGVES